jgi:citrate synthase
MTPNPAPKSLIEITEAHLNTGLRGVPVGTFRTSFVTPEGGVHYVGYPIDELAELDPEDVVFLLHYKHLPSPDEASSFRKDLAARATLPPHVANVLQAMPKKGHPMDWLAVGLQTLGSANRTEDWREDALNMTACMPELMALIFRIREERFEGMPESRPKLGLVANFVHMLDLPGADKWALTKVLRVFLVLHMDHGGGNLSTFTGKAIASSHSDIYASMVGAMNALFGPLHGRANQSCLDFVRRIGTDDSDAVEKFVRAELAAKRPIFGFGHAVLRTEDPRAAIQFALGEKICPNDSNFKIIRTLREVVPRVLGEIPKISNPNANVDIASGTLLNHVGLVDSEYYTTFFGWARTAGIGAQIVDERTIMRGGRGVPLYRPKYIAEEQQEQHIE